MVRQGASINIYFGINIDKVLCSWAVSCVPVSLSSQFLKLVAVSSALLWTQSLHEAWLASSSLTLKDTLALMDTQLNRGQ